MRKENVRMPNELSLGALMGAIMIHEEKKVTKIVEELTLFFFSVGASSIESRIERDHENVVISFCSDYHIDYKEHLHSLNDYLVDQTNDGVEDIYWELAGSGDPGETSQLLLVGMMVDKAEVNIDDKLVKLKLYKKLLG